MYADDTKIYREIREKHDQEILQKDLNSLKAWSDQWLLKFHPKKCYSITIGNKRMMITHIVYRQWNKV